ncbi:PAS domain S-box protein [Nostocaceae cyanobacterium CENA369]|uniref:histidine kinase n=1 Tax=Dendronalium phyllosphericum CENA369 TaxID=1725256 RepID=A0A8J7LDB2_9NOST|nr:PAS domain S-box protein [Dendronalium phyllosphericum]MBH8573682.1 PAS domain S-box protein [Dendronalium phyllosphericum CENA369]
MQSSVCNHEAARLKALYQYQILDTAPEQAFDDLVSLAAQICDTPIALINLIDANRHWFKAKVGLNIQEIQADLALCRFCIQQKQTLIVPDILADERFATEIIVTSEPHARFYVGVPLIVPEGQAIATLCVIDRVPRQISPKQVEALESIGRLVVRQLEIRRNLAELASIKKEYKQTQEALHQSECILRSFFNSAPMMMGIVELVDNDILHITDNLATAKFFGLTPEAMQNRLAREMGATDKHLSQWIHYYRQAERTQAPVRFEYSFDTPQKQIWLSATVSPIAISSSKHPKFAYIVEDISQRKQAEQQSREQAALLDITTDAILVQDLSHKILFWNKSAENLYGWKGEEAIDKNANRLLYGKTLPQHQEIYNSVLKNGSWRGELQNISKSGAEITVESRWTLVLDEHFQVKSILVVNTDITQKKQLEKQFLRAQRMESIGTLASGIAHDLNNVLSPIVMSVQLLKNKCSDRNTHQILSIVENNAKRGANLVKQVLSFVRGIEGDRTVLQLKHLILEMQQIVQQTFPKTIAITTEIQLDLFPVCGDSTQLHQVLMNLCLNARDAMPEGGNLSITAENISIDRNYTKMHLDAQIGTYIVLAIADTGLGIKNEFLDRIFEPFFTTKQFSNGTGLGLSTVMGIIKGHGGFITVSSCVGSTTFKVYLPAVHTDTYQSSDNREILAGYGEWILVVDDEAAIREITTTSLENHNYKTISASDGVEAMTIYAQHQDKISAAIVDIIVPNMDGATTIRALQKMNPQLPIIAVSGLATSEQIPINKASGDTAFLPKPYTVQQLLTALHTVIHNRKNKT